MGPAPSLEGEDELGRVGPTVRAEQHDETVLLDPAVAREVARGVGGGLQPGEGPGAAAARRRPDVEDATVVTDMGPDLV